MPAFLKFIIRRRTSRPVGENGSRFFIYNITTQRYGRNKDFVL